MHPQPTKVGLPARVLVALAACLVIGLVSCASRGVGTPCDVTSKCEESFCDGTWKEGTCTKATDCPGYIDVDYGDQPLGPNKRCIRGVCHQVGRCSNHHS